MNKAIHTKVIIIALLICFGFTSCINEPFELGDDANSKGVKISFTLSLPDPQKIETRALVDDALNSVYLLVFDAGNNFIEYARANENSDIKYNFIANLKEQSTDCTIYVVANVSTVMGQVAGGWHVGTTTLDDVKRDLIKANLVQPGNYIPIKQVPEIPPMISESPITTKIDKSMKIDNIVMVRTMAKITVSETVTDFTVLGATLCNAPVRGYVFPGMTLSGTDDHVSDYHGEASGSHSLEYMTRTGDANNPLYCYESAARNRTFVIIKADYKGVIGYYKVNLKNTTNDSLALQRNHWYSITVKKVEVTGYLTALEARENVALNDMPGSDVSIDVSDSYSHDIISNGEQYLGVSNSELVVYQTGAISNLEVLTLNYTTNPQWSDGTITATGVSLVNSSILPKAGATNVSIKVDLSVQSMGGTLTFRIGNLYKVVKITRNPTLAAVVEEMPFDNISMADKTGAENNMNVRFSLSQNSYEPNSQYAHRLFNNDGKTMYVDIMPNVGYQGSGRKGSFYVTHSDEKGKTKVVYNQAFLDVYAGLVQIKPYTYVATFHRHNEVAERIIRIKNVSKNLPNAEHKRWFAVVIAGEDWIELDNSRSPDPGITTFPYGYDEDFYPWTTTAMPTPLTPDGVKADNAVYRTAAEVEANCKFSAAQKGNISIQGPGNKDIYFRVGLKSTIGPNEVRYGLIALTHEQGTHLIYVRQGEAEDYIMRNGDGMARTAAIKVSPYNLSTTGASTGAPFALVGERGGVMADYPSKGGYLFKGPNANNNIAYNPYGSASQVSYGNETQTIGNHCPWGRLPNDGNSPNSSGVYTNSEIRQSFWLLPRTGYGHSSFQNIIRGYIADGYYDRRRMRFPNYGSAADYSEASDKNKYLYTKTSGDTYNPDKDGRTAYQVARIYSSTGEPIAYYPVPTIVDESEGKDMAFAGMLIYNPYNYASIFLPATGSRDMFVKGGNQQVGAESTFWSSTTTFSDNSYSYLATGFYNTTGSSYTYDYFVFDNYDRAINSQQSMPIRCVRKTGEAGSNGQTN